MKFIGAHIFSYDATFRGDVTIEGNLSVSNSVSQTISFGDNDKLKFGDGNDLEIFHDGSNSYINQRNTGDLIIQASSDDKDIILKSDDGSGGVTAYLALDGSATELVASKNLRFDQSPSYIFFNGNNTFVGELSNSGKLQLRGGGSNMAATVYVDSSGNMGLGTSAPSSKLDVRGTVQVGVDDTGHDVIFYGATSGRYLHWDESDNALELTDNTKIKLGDGSDFQFYHSGSNSFITNTVGDINIINHTDNGDIKFQGDDGAGGVAVYFSVDGGAAEHDGSSTTALYTIWKDNSRVAVGDSRDLQLDHNGTDSVIRNETGDLYIMNKADDKDIIFNCDDGSGGTTAYITLDGSAKQTVFEENVRFLDNIELRLGSGSDIKMFHLSNQGYIQNQTGHLNIQQYADDSDIIFSSDDGSGGVTEYFRLNGGFSSPYTNFPDNSTLSFGGSNDLRIYHDGTNNNINSVNGHLKIAQYSDDSDIIFYSDDGSGGLAEYFRVDGGLSTLEFAKGAVFNTGSYVKLWDNVTAFFGTGNDLRIWHSGSDSFISQEGTGDLYIRNLKDDKDILFQCDDGSGGTGLYFYLDGSAAKTKFSKFTLHEDNVKAEFGDSADLQIFHDGTHGQITNNSSNLYIKNNADDGDIIFQSDDGSGGNATYMTIDGSNSRVQFDANLYVVDGIQLRLGTGNDLRLYHSTNSYVSNEGSGDLYIRNLADDKDIIFQSDDGSGGITEYFRLDGSQASSNYYYTRFPDKSSIVFGDSNDLRVYHDSTDSSIENLTGNLYIQQKADDKDIIFRCDDGAGSNIEYFRLDGSIATHDGSATTALYTNWPDLSRISLGSGNDMLMYHDGSQTVYQNKTGNFYITQAADDKDIIFQCDDGSGGVTPYITLDGSTATTKFSKNTLHEDNVEARFGTDSDFQLYHSGSHGFITNSTGNLTIKNAADDKDILFQCDDGSGGIQTYMTIDGSDADVKVHTNIELERALTLQHASDPGDPASGHSVIWSDTSGNLKIKINVAGTTVTKTITTYE